MALATDFQAAFIKAYADSRILKSQQQWNEIWGNSYNWSNFMLYADDSVIHNSAHLLNLEWYRGEPFRLDCVFCQNANRWFPIQIAIEHENNPRSFTTELQALLSVRSRLKVGITYLLDCDIGQRHAEFREKIFDEIGHHFLAVAECVREDPETEYLFLIGSDESDNEDLIWFQLAFRAEVGPVNKFAPLN